MTWRALLHAIAAMHLRGWMNLTRRGLRSDPLPAGIALLFQVAAVAVPAALVVTAALVRIVLAWATVGGRRMREVIAILLSLVVIMVGTSGGWAQDVSKEQVRRVGMIGARALRFTHAGAAGRLAESFSLPDLAVLAL